MYIFLKVLCPYWQNFIRYLTTLIHSPPPSPPPTPPSPPPFFPPNMAAYTIIVLVVNLQVGAENLQILYCEFWWNQVAFLKSACIKSCCVFTKGNNTILQVIVTWFMAMDVSLKFCHHRCIFPVFVFPAPRLKPDGQDSTRC